MKFTLFHAVSLFFTLTTSQSVQLYNWTTAASNFSSTCVAVLNQNVTCDPSLKWAGGGRYEDDTTLSTLCTTTCSTSLSTWLRRVAGACTQRFISSQGDAILPAFWVEKVVERFNLLCLKDPSGSKFCNAVLRDEIGVNPIDQKQTKSAISTVTCDDCFLKQISTQLQMPLRSNSDMAKTFTSLTSQCAKTGFSVTPIATTTQWFSSVTPATTSGSTPTPTGCQGTKYTINSGDTCQSISLAKGLSTADLLMANKLQAFCANFPTSGTLCIPTNAICKTYTIKTGDTCASIGTANKLTWTQMVTWNPVFGEACERMSEYVGWTACVSNPGGDWVNPSPFSSTTSEIPTPTMIGTDASLLPKPTFGGMINGSDIWTYKYAQGTRLDCYIYANGTQFGKSASCADVAKGYGITTQNLTDWNPSLANNSCTLDGQLTYCVQRMRLNATSFTEYCVMTDTPDYGLTCADFMAVWGVDIDEFTAWNPGLGSGCENWLLGREYCVMARHFRQPGIVSTCNLFAMANVSNYLADPCGIIETQYGLSHARFVAWNPALGTNCTNIKYGYDYCVSIPNYKPTYSSYSPAYPTTPFHIPSINVPNPVSLFTPTTKVGTANVNAAATSVATGAAVSKTSLVASSAKGSSSVASSAKATSTKST